MSQFHINRDGTSFGIFDEAEARALFAQSTIRPTDLVWCDGMAGWLPASEGFGPAIAPPLPTVPLATAADPRYAAPFSGFDATAPSTVAETTQVPMPPKLHWGLVLLFTLLTVGLFAVVWVFRQAIWAKKIDPTSRAVWFYAGYIVLAVIANVITPSPDEASLGLALLRLVCSLGGLVLVCCGSFSVRRSMVDYFTTVEPIGLRMSGAMTFFFNTLYLQHHMTRIAKWKETGVLTPQ